MSLAVFLLASLFCTNECTGSVWMLYIDGEEVVGLEYENELDCLIAKEEFDNQTPPFTAIECGEVGVARQDG